ncbi:hypothetical protein GH714_036412 [Hevea brasiliensis]|uniref:Uncharacterized protein n=1 Tax=Hevea brasiliensis TaxID=3981 RepID=A0A6A6NKQ4_HEVBR|nr:hypothetical protein GH714_036412 [Hevea brasiliensis]
MKLIGEIHAVLQAEGLVTGSTSVKEDPIKPSYKTNKSPRKDPFGSIAASSQFAFRLLELSKFESPLARLDLSFLSNLVVTSPSLNSMPDLEKVQKAQ